MTFLESSPNPNAAHAASLPSPALPSEAPTPAPSSAYHRTIHPPPENPPLETGLHPPLAQSPFSQVLHLHLHLLPLNARCHCRCRLLPSTACLRALLSRTARVRREFESQHPVATMGRTCSMRHSHVLCAHKLLDGMPVRVTTDHRWLPRSSAAREWHLPWHLYSCPDTLPAAPSSYIHGRGGERSHCGDGHRRYVVIRVEAEATVPASRLLPC